MKCPTCESCEYEQYCGATEIMRKCERHNKKVEITNEEWFCQLPTEEKAKVLFILIENIKNGESIYTAIEKAIKDKDVKLPPITEHLFLREWLKQPHKE